EHAAVRHDLGGRHLRAPDPVRDALQLLSEPVRRRRPRRGARRRAAAGEEVARRSRPRALARGGRPLQTATRLTPTSFYGWQPLLFGPARPRVTGRRTGASVTSNVGPRARKDHEPFGPVRPAQ